jgi:hypothetical protein
VSVRHPQRNDDFLFQSEFDAEPLEQIATDNFDRVKVVWGSRLAIQNPTQHKVRNSEIAPQLVKPGASKIGFVPVRGIVRAPKKISKALANSVRREPHATPPKKPAQ